MWKPSPERLYSGLFLILVAAYCLVYAPYGINETDGGFLSGLGWQVFSGKTLYGDILYVRPPLAVWLRALEMYCLPESWSVLGERYIFYFKTALYSWLAAQVLARGSTRPLLAIAGFIVSVHNYPACAWHTTDGILLAVLAVSFYAGSEKQPGRATLAGVSLAGALLCKQSFYPLALAFPILLLLWKHPEKKKRFLFFLGGLIASILLFISYLYQHNLLQNFLAMTGGAASGGQALQHGLLDYLRIKPLLAACSALLLGPVLWWFWKGRNVEIAWAGWLIWLLLLPGFYVLEIWKRADFSSPFSQARLLFLIGLAYAGFQALPEWKNRDRSFSRLAFLSDQSALLLLLLAVSWSAAISWGYNLPILLATPWVFTALEISRRLWQARSGKPLPFSAFILGIVLLLGIARYAYTYVYRDGPRRFMTEELGPIFPRLQGIRSSPETAALYRDLDSLHRRYGDRFVVLPAFPQANFLTNTRPLLPLDWVVRRETNGDSRLILKALQETKPVLFFEKSFLKKLDEDPELEFTRTLLQNASLLQETPYFRVYRYE